MKYILYILIISVFLSSHISYSMQQSLSNRQMSMFICIAAGCGISLCLAYKYKDLIMSYFHCWNAKKKSNFVNSQDQNQYQQDQKQDKSYNILISNILTPDDMDKIIAKRKQEEKIPNKDISELHKACLDNNVQKIKELLKNKDVDINTKCPITIEDSNKQGYDYNQEETPLLIAFRLKNKDIINVLLKHKDIDVSIQNDYGATPLNYACSDNDIAMVKQLLHHPTIKLDNDKSFYTACVSGNIDIVTLLLEYNKDNCIEINNALLGLCKQIEACALKCNACDIIIDALSKNITLQNLSNWGIFYNYPYGGILELLKENRSPKNAAYQEKQKYNAERKKFMDIIHLLLENPFINLKQIKSKNPHLMKRIETVFHYAVADDELLQLLLEKNKELSEEKRCSVDAISYDCNKLPNDSTPLHAAVINGNIKSIQLLIKNGADIFKKVKEETYTPFLLACDKMYDNELKMYKEIIKYFLTLDQLIKDKDQLSEGLCILIRCYKENNDLIEQLLSCGADPNKKNNYGNSALLNISWKNLSLLNLFIDKYNGDIKQQDNHQNTIFCNAYMTKIIQKPDDINYIKQLDNDAKSEFMKHELIIIAQNPPEQIFLCGYSKEKKYINEYIEKLNNFVNTCSNYGNIQIDKIQIAEDTLLDIAYKKSQERALIPNYKYLQFNEVIIHALIPYYNNISGDQNIDKLIAKIYKNDPAQYYVQSLEYKVQIKQVLSENLENV